MLTAPFCCLSHMAPHFYYTGFSRHFYEKWLKELGFEGLLTIHGIGHRITGTARLKQAGEIIYGESNFQVKLSDYKIKIPRMVIKNIAEVVDVSIYVQFTRETKN